MESPTVIVKTQKTHLQPSACARKPPATGPRTGPSRGPIANMDIAAPLDCCGITSTTVPPPIVNGQEPAHPARNRKMMKLGMLVATAHATVKMVHNRLQTR